MALFQRAHDGECVAMDGRNTLTEHHARQMVVMEMIIMRSKGYTDSEIGIKYRYRRETVNRMINSAPDHVKERLRKLSLA